MLSKQDFLANPEFVQWVKNPNKQLDDYWDKWIKANPDQLENLKLAREFLVRLQLKDIKAEEGMKEEILNSLLKAQPAPYKQVEKRTFKSERRFWQNLSQFNRVAAILLFGFCIAWMIGPGKGSEQNTLEDGPAVVIHKSTKAGEKLHLTLPDGTHIWVNSVSHIKFPERFDHVERRIYLEGEAFFEIAEDTLRPFVVEARGLSTIALGTSFNISTKTEEQVNISLVSGKVKVLPPLKNKEFYLDPGKELKFDTKSQREYIGDFNIKNVTAWKNGTLLFKDASLRRVVKELEEWYGISIRVINGDRIDWNFSGEFQHQTLESVLESLSYIQKFNYSINGKNVEFKF
ncbi:FecR family protein [Negadavirga shengliensis]|uniref:FecR family protein n=1 Tax=Negadavirga shengliensis TaxID=1389218 RepID=A0ABV9SX90_9BACT